MIKKLLLLALLLAVPAHAQEGYWIKVDSSTGRIHGWVATSPTCEKPAPEFGVSLVYAKRLPAASLVRESWLVQNNKFVHRSQADIDATTSAAELPLLVKQLLETQTSLSAAVVLSDSAAITEYTEKLDTLKTQVTTLRARVATGNP